MMMTRRDFLRSAMLVGGALTLPGCPSQSGETEYERAVRKMWRHTAGAPKSQSDMMRELVRYATLAPSSHNTQCWKFRPGGRSVTILPDMERRCPVVDPDNHHLYLSLGCAAENLVHAALAMGHRGRVSFMADAGDAVEIALEPTKAVSSALFQAILTRQSTRSEYDGKPLSYAQLKLLEKAGTGNGVQVLLLTEKQLMEQVLEYVIQGNTAQMRDPAFVAELKEWIRFNHVEAVGFGDGLFSHTSGNPSVPHWLGSMLFNLFFTESAENDKYARHIRSSAGIAVFVSEADDKLHWVETGRTYERFALQAASMGVRNAFLNQPVEVPESRRQFAKFLGISNGRPDLIVRFGKGCEMPRSLRRPVEAVFV